MKNNLDSLKYVITYKNTENVLRRHSCSNYDAAYGYYKEKMESFGNAQ